MRRWDNALRNNVSKTKVVNVCAMVVTHFFELDQDCKNGPSTECTRCEREHFKRQPPKLRKSRLNTEVVNASAQDRTNFKTITTYCLPLRRNPNYGCVVGSMFVDSIICAPSCSVPKSLIENMHPEIHRDRQACDLGSELWSPVVKVRRLLGPTLVVHV